MNWSIKALLFISCATTFCYVALMGKADLSANVKRTELISPVVEIKNGNKWIVVTSVSAPTEDVKVNRFSGFK